MGSRWLIRRCFFKLKGCGPIKLSDWSNGSRGTKYCSVIGYYSSEPPLVLTDLQTPSKPLSDSFQLYCAGGETLALQR